MPGQNGQSGKSCRLLNNFAVHQATANMNTRVTHNYAKLKPTLFLWPAFVLLCIVLVLFCQESLNPAGYIQVQKDAFLYLNGILGQYPRVQFNLTQLGDALIFLSLLSLFIRYAPVLWESLISASLLSAVVSSTLKNLFTIPRPAAALDTKLFIIIGDTLPGHSSLPSGHAITIFTTLTILLFALMPNKFIHRLGWTFSIMGLGLLLSFTRVGVGAHYPLDVLVGSAIGFLCGITGIFLSRRFTWWRWIGNKRYSPFFIVLLSGCGVVLVSKIMYQALPVYFFSLAALIISLYTITNDYFKK